MKFFLSIAVFVCLAGQTLAQQAMEKPHDYLIIIGAFLEQSHAEKMASIAKRKKLNPTIEFNKTKNLYYVFVGETKDRTAAVEKALSLRNDKAFADAWVFHDMLQPEPVQEKPVEIAPAPEVPVAKIAEPEPEPVKPEPVKVDSAKLREERIKAEVAARSMVIKKGDWETLNNIYFFKDAAVLRPESKYEVERLAKVMRDHPGEKIRIHGHTNGNAPGKIIKRANDTADFYSLDNTVEDYGSAKELSELRATVIRDILVTMGIEKHRMEIKPWGGKKPLFKVDDPKAEANVRVEIEVIK